MKKNLTRARITLILALGAAGNLNRFLKVKSITSKFLNWLTYRSYTLRDIVDEALNWPRTAPPYKMGWGHVNDKVKAAFDNDTYSSAYADVKKLTEKPAKPKVKPTKKPTNHPHTSYTLESLSNLKITVNWKH